MAKLKPENLELALREHGRPSLSCTVDGYRYHVWLDPETLKPEDDTLFKNPPADAPREEGSRRGRTLHLSQSRGFGAKLVPLMLAAVPDLLPAARAKLADDIAERKERTQAVWREHYAKEAGPLLLAAARSVLVNPSADNMAKLAQAVAAGEGRT